VDTPEGLVVPIIKDADRKGIVELSQELGRLTAGSDAADAAASVFLAMCGLYPCGRDEVMRLRPANSGSQDCEALSSNASTVSVTAVHVATTGSSGPKHMSVTGG
jgi:2-oxoacid dehydrogenases acyltransferase (catalytic domain)